MQTARLSCGLRNYDVYDVYVKHLHEHHPEREVPSYEAFFRERQAPGYQGHRRPLLPAHID